MSNVSDGSLQLQQLLAIPIGGRPPPADALDHLDGPTNLAPGVAAFTAEVKNNLFAMIQAVDPAKAVGLANPVSLAPTPLVQLNLLGDEAYLNIHYLAGMTGKYTPRSMFHAKLACRTLTRDYFTALHVTAGSTAAWAAQAWAYARALNSRLYRRGFQVTGVCGSIPSNQGMGTHARPPRAMAVLVARASCLSTLTRNAGADLQPGRGCNAHCATVHARALLRCARTLRWAAATGCARRRRQVPRRPDIEQVRGKQQLFRSAQPLLPAQCWRL